MEHRTDPNTNSQSSLHTGVYNWASEGLPGMDSSHLRSMRVDTVLGQDCYGKIVAIGDDGLSVKLYSEVNNELLGYMIQPYSDIAEAIAAGDALLSSLSNERLPYGFFVIEEELTE